MNQRQVYPYHPNQSGIINPDEVASNGLEYLAGWEAKTNLKTYPRLGYYTQRNNPIDPGTLPSWGSHFG